MIFFLGGGAKEESGKVEDLILSIYIHLRQKMRFSLVFFVCHFWKWTVENLSAALFSFRRRGRGEGGGSALEGANQEEGKRKTIGLVCNLFVFLPSRWGGKKKKGLLLIFATL